MASEYWILFGIGVGGALVTAYIGRSGAVPDFRELADTTRLARDLEGVRRTIIAAQGQLDRVQDRIEKGGRSAGDRLLLTTTLAELKQLRLKEHQLGGRLFRIRLWSRSIGIASFVLLGGLIAALLAGSIEIDFISSPQENGALDTTNDGRVAAFVIGMSWPAYLHTLLGRARTESVRQGVEESLEDVRGRLERRLKDLEDRLPASAGKNQPVFAAARTEFQDVFQQAERDLSRDVRFRL